MNKEKKNKISKLFVILLGQLFMQPEGYVFAVGDIVKCYCEEFESDMDAEILCLSEDQTQVYIHFVHQDKRLDKWILMGDIKGLKSSSKPREDRVLSRHSRRLHESGSSDDDSVSSDGRFEQIHREVTKVRNIQRVTIGKYDVPAWYYAPYPPPYHDMQHLYICEYCWRYFESSEALEKHHHEKKEMRPAGREIYRKGKISIFELSGKRQKVECQCLCLLAKLFLDHKTLFYDVEGFIFYVLCECDEDGAHIAAYFSKEIRSECNILACIVALPQYQKMGYGRMLISLSYEIAKRDKVSGGPERPLSDLGKIAFHAYWRDTLVDILRNREREITTIADLEQLTSIDSKDIISVLKEISCVTQVKGKYELSINKEQLNNAIATLDGKKRKAHIDPDYLIWLPGSDDKQG